MELEQRVSVLEWQLENTKQKMEIQEMSYRRELSSAREKVSSLGSSAFPMAACDERSGTQSKGQPPQSRP